MLRRASYERGKLRVVLTTLSLGALAFAPALFIERTLQDWSGIDRYSESGAELTTILAALLVVAPLEQALVVAAVAPMRRSAHFRAPLDGLVLAAAAGLGFVTAHNAVYLVSRPALSIDPVRALFAVPAHVFFAGLWGWALARDPERRLGGRSFEMAWVVAVLFNGLYDHLVFGRHATALAGAVPLLACIGLLGHLAIRDLAKAPVASGRGRGLLPSIAPPSIRAMRESLRRTERPVMLAWIPLGALVTTGVMTAALAGAVALGHRLGIDFAAVDRGETSTAGAAPLFLLAGAALAAFPVAGYLVARASSTRSVLEPAMGASLAIAGFLVLLGLAAPVAVVFAIACAPVAFGLACAGAFMGIGR